MNERDLSLKDTLFSGQCFRVKQENDVFTVKCGIDEDVKCLSLKQNQLEMIEKDEFWAHYFDIETDYDEMKVRFSGISPVMAAACAYAPGIRILNQDPWEALCSFVVSQNNNIKRIMGIIDRLCVEFGSRGENGEYGFPSAEKLKDSSEDSLRACGLGFRAPYIKNVSKAVCDGSIDIGALSTIDLESAFKMLTNVKGIGPKVASCALLFGCHRLDCFPMDVWMKRVMENWFPGMDSSVFGENAGVAQQYLFHYARTEVKNDF